MTRAPLWPLFLAAALIPCALTKAEAIDGPVVTGELGTKLDDFLSRLADWGFAGTIVVAKDNQVVLAKGYGLADRDKKIPMTTDTVISIGSITKQFTAAAILKLEMQGKLKVTDSIDKYFTGVPEDKKSITLHHLLTHSSGLVSDFGDDFEKVTRDEIVRRAMASKLLWKPGHRYRYSNAGYSLLGAILEIVSGRPYEAFLHDNLFVPTGMMQTGYRLAKWKTEDIARGYDHGKRFGTILERPWAQDGPYWNLRANGGIHSTIGDMYRWYRALEGEAILSKEAKEKLFKPHVPEGPMQTSFYGYGWSISTTPRKTKLIGHNGSNGIFYAAFGNFVDEGIFAYLATNDSEFANNRLENWLARAIFGGNYPTPPRCTALAGVSLSRYAGTYQLPSGDQFVIAIKDDRLVVTARGPEAMALLLSGRRGDAKHLSDYSARTAAIEKARATGDYTPLHKALAANLSLEDLKQRASAARKEMEQEHGRFEGFGIIGSVPAALGGQTFVRLRFGRGTAVIRYEWEGSRLRGVRDAGAAPLERTFVPQSKTQFVTFSFDSPQPLVIDFVADQTGQANSLSLQTRDGPVVAKRIGS
jgi:CubicO group peptidase (beta-lactamase class C family)